MAHGLRLLQQRQDQGKKIFCHLGIPLLGRMNAIGLHAAGDSIHILQQERQHGYVVRPPAARRFG